jgi:hypothetical protein
LLSKLLLAHQQPKRELVAFIQSQVALTRALFKFREAWQGPPAMVYDPKHLLSSEDTNRYDLLHLAANYHLHLFHDRREFARRTGLDVAAPLYVEIVHFRDLKLALGFDYPSSWERAEFEERCCRSVVALRGLKLIAKERGLESKPVILDERIRNAVEHDYVPCLIVAEVSWWPLLSVLKGSPFYARELLVDFPDGTSTPYKVITGTAAFHIHPELKRHYAMLDKKLSDDAIIL